MFGQKLIVAALLTGTALPTLAAGENYAIDSRHTYPSLEFSHRGISIWRGKFNKTRGSVVLDRAAKSGTVDIVIDMASINFGLDAMDEKARSEEWFDVARFPTAHYRGTLQFVGDTPRTVEGTVTIKGVTRPVPLTLHLFDCVRHPILKKELCGADAEGELNWSDFGMKKFGEGETDKVRLRVQVEGLKQD